MNRICTRTGWPDFTEALKTLHAPKERQDVEPQSPYMQRVAYDELLASQLALANGARQHAYARGH